MTATEIKFTKFLEENQQNKLLIPIYQRAYEWTTKKDKEVDKLWEDIDNIDLNDENSSHFLNSIVFIKDDLNEKSINIIDGQQRITTLSILFIAIRDRLKTILNEVEKKLEKSKKNLQLEDEKLSLIREKKDIDNFFRKISRFFLEKDIYDHENERIHLSLSNKNNDRNIYYSLVDAEEIKNSSNIVKTYNFFYKTNKIRNFAFQEIKTLFEKLERIFIVKVELDLKKDNPQVVFSSLNSGGLKLKDTDLIKNTVFMKLPLEEQEKIHSELWEILEDKMSDKKLSLFFQHFLTMKLGRVVTNNSIYEEFVNKYLKQINSEIEFIDNEDKNSLEARKVRYVLEEMQKFSDIYLEIDKKAENIFSDFDVLISFDIEAYFPFLMKIKEKNSPFTSQVLKIIESYYVRRFVYGLPPGYTKNIFASVCKDSELEIDENLIASFTNFLSKKENHQRFPSNTEFSESLKTRNLFTNTAKDSKVLKSFYISIEKEKNPKFDIDFNDLSIEHILPQNKNNQYEELKDCWKENFREHEFEKYLNIIGNLTILTIQENSSNSNHCFENKLKIFRSSDLYLNEKISEFDHWDKTSLESRSQQLIKLALTKWKSLNEYLQ